MVAFGFCPKISGGGGDLRILILVGWWGRPTETLPTVIGGGMPKHLSCTISCLQVLLAAELSGETFTVLPILDPIKVQIDLIAS